MSITYSKYQLDIFDAVSNRTYDKMVVNAVAGSGKTFTTVKCFDLLPDSEESIFVAFNKHIATELSRKLPQSAKAVTYHSLGFAAVRQAYGNLQLMDDKNSRYLRRYYDEYRWLHSAVSRLISLHKANLLDASPENVIDLSLYHDLDIPDVLLATEMVDGAMKESAQVKGSLDFDDMCWLPVYNKLGMKKYDFLAVDELQDTNFVQAELISSSINGHSRLLGVGDPYQSIYGFRGADANAVDHIISRFDATVLPLSITYRCPLAVVRYVNDHFSYIKFEASPTAKDGKVEHIKNDNKFIEKLQSGDMVLCRTNAPLVEVCFALIRKGVKAIIKGRDIGKGLQAIIKKLKASDLNDLINKLVAYRDSEVSRALMSEKTGLAQQIQDKCDTLLALSDNCQTIYDLNNRIETIFSDDVEGVCLSSVHKAKGLEAEKVYVIRPDLMPHPLAKKGWQREQENNIAYVATTRALDELYLVDE